MNKINWFVTVLIILMFLLGGVIGWSSGTSGWRDNRVELQLQKQIIDRLIDGIKTADVNLKIDQDGNQYGEITIYYER
jgi:hypothetical protein